MSATQDLKGVFEVGQDSRALFAKARLMIHFSGKARAIYSKFFVGVDASTSLYAKFKVQEKKDLKAKFVIRHPAAQTLFAKFDARFFFVEGWAAAKALLTIRQAGSIDGPKGELIVRNIGVADVPRGSFIVRHTDSAEFKGIAEIRHSAAITGPKGITEIRHSAAVDLFGDFKIRRSASLDGPKGVFIVQHWKDLKAIVTVRQSTYILLKARFWTRFPMRLWTNRRYINGVVDLSELDMGDAILEYVIEGVMEDVQGELEANSVDYSTWTDITRVPVLIRRAVTYGTVAALYARRARTFRSRVIPSVSPVTVTVLGDEQLAMQHWEGRMNKALNDYLTNIDVDRILVSTADQEPVFSSTLEDIPPEIDRETSWHDWLRQRNR